ncbi:MAG TPA: YqaA family protein [bacterium]|nr:YqaA family protein [bacterium]HPS30455.1 YqaA family protein [bacterium]
MTVETKKKNIVRRLYDWVLHWADTKYGTPALATLSFAESSFFPVPPDVLLIALNMGKPKKSFYYALVCSIASIVGGMLGYYIGAGLWSLLSGIFFSYIPGFTPEIFAKVQGMYNEYGFAAVLIAGFTPIPYKVFTISSGVFGMSFPLFVLASVISRSARFFIVSAMIYFFGEPIKKFIDKYFNLLSGAFVVLIILGFFAIKYLF